MDIIKVFEQFPTKESCIEHLEKIRWKNEPECPYCHSHHYSDMKDEYRYHCNKCNTSYSVTVGTIFHNTKLPLQKWFVAVALVINAKKGISARQLARDIHVTKDTAWRIQMQIRKAMQEYGELLQEIVEADETYIGGKNKNRHNSKKTKGGQGRGGEDKQAVFGLLERDGKIIARKVDNVKKETLKRIIVENVGKGTIIMTDEWHSYKGLDKHYTHKVVKHAEGKYVDGYTYTNTLEGFWSLFKRGFVGQYHQLSTRYIDRHLVEFCFRYNHRKSTNLFGLVLERGVCVL